MQKAQKAVLLPVIAVVGGLVGLFVRQAYLNTDFDPGTGLYTGPTASAYGMWVVLILVLAALVVLTRGEHRVFQDQYTAAFALDHQATLIGNLAGVFLFAAAGVLNIYGYISAPVYLMTGQKEVSIVRALLGFLCLMSAVSIFLIAKRLRAGQPVVGLLPVIPGFTSCIWVMSNYQIWAQEPVLQGYLFYLLAVLLSMVACYFLASFAFGKGQVALTLVLCLLSASLCIMVLGDGLNLYDSVLCLAMVFYLLSMAGALLIQDGKPQPSACPPTGCQGCPGCAPQPVQEEKPEP
jgi:hypothetical protein